MAYCQCFEIKLGFAVACTKHCLLSSENRALFSELPALGVMSFFVEVFAFESRAVSF